MSQLSRASRAKAIKHLTNNGRKRKVVSDLERMMSDEETLKILNALFKACEEKE